MSASVPEVALSAVSRHAGRHDARRPVTMAPRPPVPATRLSDAVLVARVVAADDRHAFAELTRRHQSAVRAQLRRLTRNDRALADDLAQDTFIQVYRNLRQFRGDAKFTTWIYRIAYNAFLAHIRSAHPEEELPEQLPDEGAGPSPADASAMKMDLAKALATLSEGERAATIQCYYQELSHEEAAYVLGCPLGTVKTNVLRAKQKLRSVLAAWSPDSV
jgi:RNA polymerase sigma-70 factor (ECF subfamily)